MKSTRKGLFTSVVSLLLCLSMLIGTTFAWFTDSVTSGTNQIVAGNLDIEVKHTNAKVTDQAVAGATNLFTDKNGNAMLWEPGAVAYETFNVANVGTLALKYNMSMNITDYNTVKDTTYSLKDVLKVKVLEGNAIQDAVTRESVAALDWSTTDTLNVFQKSGGKLYPEGTADQNSSEKFQVIVYWQPDDNDNNWNVNNSKTTADGQPLFINFGITVVATQLEHESDSFDNLYDADAVGPNIALPSWSGESAAAALNTTEETTYQINQQDKIKASVTVPATGATYEDGTAIDAEDPLKLVVVPGVNENTGVKVENGNSITTYDVSLVNATTGNKVKSTNPMKTTLEIGLVDLIRFYHNGTEYTNRVNSVDQVDEVGKFYYNETTGIVTFMTKDFSPFSAVYKFAGGLGSEAYPYLISNADHLCAFRDAINSGFTARFAKLTADINISGKNWQPIGTWQYPYHGEFDGNGHKIIGLTGSTNSLNADNWFTTNTTKVTGSAYGFIAIAGNGELKIKNLEFKDVNIDLPDDGSCVGTVLGYAPSQSDFGAADKAGTYAGQHTACTVIEIDGITVSGKVTAKTDTSGIAAKIYGGTKSITVKNCTNNAAIEATNAGGRAAGIVSFISNNTYSDSVTITGNTNNGSVKGKVNNAGRLEINGITEAKVADHFTYTNNVNNGAIVMDQTECQYTSTKSSMNASIATVTLDHSVISGNTNTAENTYNLKAVDELTSTISASGNVTIGEGREIQKLVNNGTVNITGGIFMTINDLSNGKLTIADNVVVRAYQINGSNNNKYYDSPSNDNPEDGKYQITFNLNNVSYSIYYLEETKDFSYIYTRGVTSVKTIENVSDGFGSVNYNGYTFSGIPVEYTGDHTIVAKLISHLQVTNN